MSKLVQDFSKFEKKTVDKLEKYAVKKGVYFVVKAGKIVQVVEDPKMREFCEAAHADFEQRKLATENMRKNINENIDTLAAASTSAPVKVRK